MIEAFGATDIGHKRQRNEDAFKLNQDINLYVVADGMGGHNAGDVASTTAVNTIESYAARSHEERELTWPFGIDPNLSLNGNRLRTALKLANHKVWQLADSHQEYTGMGTTVVGALVHDDIATIVSVGDSRVYLLRGDQIKPLTRDDVWLNETWVRKAFTEDQLQKLPLKNVLSKAIGSKEDVDFPIQELHMQHEDVIIFCTDGLHGMVTPEQLLSVAIEYRHDMKKICETLIHLANEAGGKDNITVIALRYSK